MFTFANDKLSVLKVWQNALHLYRHAFAKIWYIFIIEFGLILLLQIPAIIEKGDATTQISTMSIHIKNIASLLAILINLFVLSTVMHRTRSIVLDYTAKLRVSVKSVWQKFIPIIISLLLLFVVGLLLILVLFSVQGLNKFIASSFSASLSYYPTLATIFAVFLVLFSFLGTLFIFFIPLILFKNKNYTAIFASAKLVWGSWWRTFLVVFIPGVALSLLVFIGLLALAVLIKNSVVTMIILGVFTLYGILFLKPFLSSLLLTQFNDLLNRKGESNLNI
jgi:hypothetical protein